ncbi:hypothetical protein B0H10DRAFT_1962171 [Mycena sp. CBHHK59/15]|nr:hypothetical protein B0H10DRAFT_1962171 [Mycena sp. CBHHK59/15]
MRDAAALDPFRFTPNAFITANVIRVAAEKAFADRQKQKKSVIKPTEAGGEQQEVEEEELQHKKSRTTDGTQTALSRTTPSTGRSGTSNPRVPQNTASSLRQVITADNELDASSASAGSQPPIQFSNTFQSTFLNYP